MGLSAQRLLRDQRIGTDRAGVNFVGHQVAELHHVDVTDDDFLVEGFAGATVVEMGLAVVRQGGLLEVIAYFLFFDAVEHGGGKTQAQQPGRPPEVRLEHLTDIHARRHAQRVQDDVHRRSVGEIRHVFLGHNFGHDTLVAVAAGHLVAHRQFALGRDIDLHGLDDACIDFVTGLGALHLLIVLHLQVVELLFEAADDFVDLVANRRGVDFDAVVDVRQFAQQRLGDLAVGGNDDFAGLGVDHVERNFLAEQDVAQGLGQLLAQFLGFALVLLLDLPGMFLRFARRDLRATLFRLLFGGNFDIHHDAVRSRRHFQRSVLHVRRLFAEDGAEQPLFGRQFGLALGRDFADENVARLDLRADANDAVQAEVLQRLFTQVRNVARDFLRSKLGVARADFKLVNVDRSKDVVLDDSLTDEDGVFEIISVPRHERAQDIAPQRQFAAGRTRTVGDHLASLGRVAFGHQNLLVNARRRVGAHELAYVINVNAFLRVVFHPLFTFGQLAVLRDHYLIAGNRDDFSAFLRHDDGARVASHPLFQTRGDQWRFGDDQRHRLALHVGPHQGAVGVVMLEERNQTGGHRNELLGRHVHVIDARRFHINEVAFATAGHTVGREVAPVVDRRVCLGDDKRLFAVGGQVVDMAGHAPLFDLAIRRFDETEIVDPREGRQRRNQTDVRTFRSFHRTDASIV